MSIDNTITVISNVHNVSEIKVSRIDRLSHNRFRGSPEKKDLHLDKSSSKLEFFKAIFLNLNHFFYWHIRTRNNYSFIYIPTIPNSLLKS